MAHDALSAHARDELGLSEIHSARPIQAALASATTFAGSSLTASHCLAQSDGVHSSSSGRRLSFVLGAFGSVGRTSRRRKRCHRCRSSDTLGDPGNGSYSGRRDSLRYRCGLKPYLIEYSIVTTALMLFSIVEVSYIHNLTHQ
jgi:hypothetical protein